MIAVHPPPIQRVLDALGDAARSSGSGWLCRCPAHDDAHASLSVNEGDDGKALLNCFAGCTAAEVAAALGLTLADLFPAADPARPPRAARPAAKKDGNLKEGKAFPTADAAVAALERRHGTAGGRWEYHDPHGELVGVVLRFDRPDGSKDFRPVSRHPDGWRVAGMPAPRPLYRLPDLAGADTVYVVEGEKCADALRSLGYAVTTSSGGANAARHTDWSPLAGKTVVILPDNDGPGRKYAADVVNLTGALNPAPNVRVVNLPGLPDKGDIAGWLEARRDTPADEVKAEFDALVAAAKPVADPDPWPEPVQLGRTSDPPAFPTDVLPGWVREFVEALAVEKQVPVDLVALLVLAALSGGISRKVVVTPRPGWEWEPVNLYALVALLPGERKTQVFKAVFAFLNALEKELREKAEPEVKKAESEFRVAEGRVKHIEGRIAKCEDAGERKALGEDLTKAREELAKVAVPAMPLLRVDDDTPEMMGKELVLQGGRLLAASPEAKAIENLTAYSDDPNLDVFLKGHAGDDIRSGRVTRGRDTVERPALTCAFSVQPCVVESLGRTPVMRGRGLLGRWYYGLPDSRVGYREIGAAAVTAAVRDEYAKRMTDLWGTDYPDPQGGTPHELRLSADAMTELERFEQWVEERLRPGGTLGDLAGWGNKLCGLCVRLCGVLHAGDGGENWQFTEVSAGVLRRAVRVCKTHAIPHALAAFDLMGANPAVAAARTLLRWIGRRPDPVAEFSKRDAFNGCRGTFDAVPEIEPALDLLGQHYLIRPKNAVQRAGPGRKPSPEFQVNPAAFADRTPTHIPQNTHNSGRTPLGGGRVCESHIPQNTTSERQTPISAESAYSAGRSASGEPASTNPISGKSVWEDANQFHALATSRGKAWSYLIAWLNDAAKPVPPYPPDATFDDILKDHLRLAAEHLRGLPAARGGGGR